MPNELRRRRIVILGARVQLATAVADVVNLSRTGVLIQAGQDLSVGSEWPLVLELNEGALMRLQRVVRSTPVQIPLDNGVLQKRYAIALAFVRMSAEAQVIIDQACERVELNER